MEKNLTKGSILKTLITLALPIMGTSFLQMAYNMTDMIWLGRVGSNAVAAAGTAGFYMWLSFAFVMVSKIGTEIKVSQSLGRGKREEAEKYGISGFQFNILVAVLYGLFIIIFRKGLIDFFNLSDEYVISRAISYLSIVTIGMIFAFTNPMITGIFNAYGDSKTPFLFNTVGLVANMVLDPMLILGFDLGVKGAAIATIVSQLTVTVLFIGYVKSGRSVLGQFHFTYKPSLERIKEITKLGIPVAIQSGLFTIFSMIVAKIIAFWGPVAIAAQKVGAQIESISWMTAGGFQGALAAFTGQNYGAKEYKRIEKGYYLSMVIMGSIGIMASLAMFFFAKEIFSVFIPEEESIKIGTSYLRIISISQLFMCIEITTGGAFNGIGKTMPPSIVGIIFNALRIPASLYLAKELAMGLDGVWWTISISSVFKGVIMVSWFLIILKKGMDKVKSK